MASASTRAPSLSEPPRSNSTAGRRPVTALLACLLVMAVLPWAYGRMGARWSTSLAVVLMLAACGFWHFHLQMAGLPRDWSRLFGVLLGGAWVLTLLRHSGRSLLAWVSALGCGVFVYDMLWVFKMHEREVGLRPIATAALVLSIGVLAKPAVLMVCVALSLLLLFDERRSFGGVLESALLLFTPVALCVSFLFALNVLSAGSFARIPWITPQATAAAPLRVTSFAHELWAAWFGLAALVSRLITGKADTSDLAYLCLALLLPTLGVASRMPDPISVLDLSVVLGAGAACLVALDPPRSTGA